MPAVLEAYDRVIQDEDGHRDGMSQRLLKAVQEDIESGRLDRADARQRLAELCDYYEAGGKQQELEAVADVLDCFDGWSPQAGAV